MNTNDICTPSSFAVGSIYAIGKGIDRNAFERIALGAFLADEEAMLAWPGREAAIEEIGGDEDERRAMLGWETLSVAQELVAARLRRCEAVNDALDAEIEDALDDEEIELAFAVRGSCPEWERVANPGIHTLRG